jgi:S-adenosylmethionine:tRNA ribosyltransferase-isomerase
MTKSAPSVFDAIALNDYRYTLPDDKIAKYPLAERDQSKLLVYRPVDTQQASSEAPLLRHHHFYELPELLPADSLLVFNNTKVIPARLIFRKATGALIELFLLQPLAPTTDIQLAMGARGFSTWECMIGNKKRWKPGQPLQHSLTIGQQKVTITATLQDQHPSAVNLHWSPQEITFAEIVEATGEIPLPPYLKRSAEHTDKERYQTVYSRNKGAVAAPTAGLHFTAGLLHKLAEKGIKTELLTLHVGAGTFQPIKAANLADHPMHCEQVIITEENVQNLLEHRGPVLAVGTTSMRTLESLYWYGLKLLRQPDAPFFVRKNEWLDYGAAELLPYSEVLAAVLKKIQALPDRQLKGETEIFIVPGYPFKVCKGLITNFHQPESTLMLLVAAFVGNSWKRIYEEALSNDYRFLSYGDSSLLLP